MTEYEREYYHDVMVIKNVLIRIAEAIEKTREEFDLLKEWLENDNI